YGTHANNKGEATLTWNVAALENKLNDYENAQIAYGRARDLFKLSGDIFNEATVVKHLARLEKNNGKTDEAAKLYNEAATLYTSIGNKKALADLKSEAEQLL
ncbi:MAG TPA: tetratricopeptide repeat protein, partial [Emcibacteraceae bacterium]|nr:tetratricopeptide repeat protein [Emcibacteraceae bacterium]